MFVVLDLETTGLDPKNDAIIEYAFILFDRHTFQEVSRFHGFVNPEKDIPAFVTSLTHIDQDRVKQEVLFSEVRDDIQSYIAGYPLLGHNINFDIQFLVANGIDVSKNLLMDTFHLANFLLFDISSLNLGYLCEHFSIPLVSAHRAIDDAHATLQFFEKSIHLLLDGYEKYPYIYDFIFQKCEHSGFAYIYATYLKKNQKKEILSEESFQSNYLSTLKSQLVEQKLIQETKTNMQDQNRNMFRDNPAYDYRESQKNMMDIVDKSLNSGEKVFIEAPTGTGKTFGYLIPAIEFSQKTGKQVCISTSTKVLQDQIYNTDIYTLQNEIGYTFTACVLKGKRNYLNLYGLFVYSESKDIFSPIEASFMLKFLLWGIKTQSGDLSELQLYGEEFYLLFELQGYSYNFQKKENAFSELDFYSRARKKAEISDIIITNTSVLVQDMLSERVILSGVDHLCIDEAHTLEEVVSSASESHISLKKIEICLGAIDQKIKKSKLGDTSHLKEKQFFLSCAEEIFFSLGQYLSSRVSMSQKYKNILIKKDFFIENDFLILMSENFRKKGKELLHTLSQYDTETSLVSSELEELAGYIKLFTEFLENAQFDTTIYALYDTPSTGLEFRISVLHVGNFLKQYLWDNLSSVVLCSATLSLPSEQGFFQKLYHAEDFSFFSLDSDFDYSSQALLYIPDDIGDIRSQSRESFEFLKRLFLITKGKTLVLCTAYITIQQIFETLKLPLENEGIELLTQSLGGSKSRHIEYFKKNYERSILVGTDSFWQGVDFPGSMLEYLVIYKTPFIAPNDPVFQARSQLYKDSFSEYALPKAIIKLKQGFGRLIRSKNDVGIVVFLDTRIISTKWGYKLYDAFPKDIKIRIGKSEKLLEILAEKSLSR